MKIYGNILTEDIQVNKGTALVIGKFDGLHKGHRMLIEMLSKAREEEGLQTAIFTFVKSTHSRFAQTRYSINLVALAPYRVIFYISKISTEIYINEKKTFFFVEKCLFFWVQGADLNHRPPGYHFVPPCGSRKIFGRPCALP